MKSIWLYPFIIFAGILQALGVSMNAQLRISLINPWLASAVSFGPIFVFFTCACMVMPRPWPTLQMLIDTPWWAPLGGLAGAVAVFAGLTIVDKIGAAPLNGMIITTNILASIVIDHFGLLNLPVHQASLGRIMGAIFMVCGIILISKF
ncbi:MAG: DMT family transporter [Candidatus Micrarchaeaceae archaeon]